MSARLDPLIVAMNLSPLIRLRETRCLPGNSKCRCRRLRELGIAECEKVHRPAQFGQEYCDKDHMRSAARGRAIASRAPGGTPQRPLTAPLGYIGEPERSMACPLQPMQIEGNEGE